MQPQQDNQTGQPAVPAMFQRSLDAFYRDLPELLKSHCGRWVAYHGDQCLGFARTQTELHLECLRRGLSEEEFTVEHISPTALHDNEELETFPDG
jgi:hypothetical protein